MYRKVSFFCVVMVLLCSCGTLHMDLEPKSSADAPIATATVSREPETGLPSPVLETPTPQVDSPGFSEIYFYNPMETRTGCGVNYQPEFPARVRQIYASWRYARMRQGLNIRREWYRDGKLWLQRDEAWDFSKYGADGTISDISIYDFDAGLEPGSYELQLYIDGQAQFQAGSGNGFLIDSSPSLEIASPNKLLTAIFADPQKLMIREADGTQWELLRANEISSLAWFSDSRHIVYSDVDHSRQTGCGDPRILSALWIVDAASGEKHQVGLSDERLHDALVSPAGDYIAAFDGSGHGDACWHDQKLLFIKLDKDLKRIEAYRPEDFGGVTPGTSDSTIYPVGSGAWQDATHFSIGLDWTCVAANDPGGTYSFDLATKQATRTGDLPANP